MKKIISYLMIIAMTLALATPQSAVFAQTDTENISVSFETGSAPFVKTQYRKISYTITNHGKAVGIKTSLYLDDELVMPENPNYVVLYGQRSGSADVYIPHYLDSTKEHSFVLKIKCSNGNYTEKSLDFLLDNDKKINLQFMSYPQSLDAGSDIPLAVKVGLPDEQTIYSLRTAIEINGVRYSELDTVQTVSDGQVIYFNIPGTYTASDLAKYSVKLIANPEAQDNEPTGSIEVDIPMAGSITQVTADVMSLVKPVIITAYVHRDTAAYAYGSLTGYRTTIPAGTYVAYLNPDNHNSMRAAKVRTQTGAVYWVPMSNIYISKENYVIADTLTNEQKELFVNGKGYSSKTPYLVWVNLERQILTVFLGSKGNWKFVKSFPVASGKNTTPTPTVEHEIEYVTRWVTPSYTCYPVLALYDGYAIHNQPVSPSGYVTDSTIGRPASAGCVRMLQKDINWVHAYVPVKTNVVIY